MSPELNERMTRLCRRATARWGREAQEDVAFGEMAELLSLIGKRAQGRDVPEQWVDEIADVTIMMRQMAILHGEQLIELRIAEKLTKLEGRLRDAGEKPKPQYKFSDAHPGLMLDMIDRAAQHRPGDTSYAVLDRVHDVLVKLKAERDREYQPLPPPQPSPQDPRLVSGLLRDLHIHPVAKLDNQGT